MKKMRYGAMAITVAVAVGAFLGAQRMDLLPGPWSKDRLALRALARSVDNLNRQLAFESEPEHYMDYYRRGLAFQRRHELERALADLDAAVKLSPTPKTAAELGPNAFNSRLRETHTMNMVVLVHRARAEILQRMNRPAEALADLDHAIALDARGSDAFHTRGLLLTYAGRYDDAIADFDFLLSRRTDPHWIFGRGVAYYLKGDWTKAARDFTAATKLVPQALIWLTKTHLRTGQPLPSQPFAHTNATSPSGATIAALMSDQEPAQHIRTASMEGRHAARCPAALFAGEWLTIRKDREGAREMFVEATGICPPLSLEHATATAELARLPQ